MLECMSGQEILDLAVQLRPIRWVWTEKMLKIGGPQIVGYKRGAYVYGLDAQNVRSVLSEKLGKAGLRVVAINPSTGLLSVNYRLVAVVLFIATGAANSRYRLLRPRLDRLVPYSGLQTISRWRLLFTLRSVTFQDRCHDHLASLKWFVGQLESLENKLRINSVTHNAYTDSDEARRTGNV
jgi:hypothetical protein